MRYGKLSVRPYTGSFDIARLVLRATILLSKLVPSKEDED